MHMIRLFCGLMAVVILTCSAVGNTKLAKSKKSLPLDNIPNVVLKSPENSKYLPGRVIVKLNSSPQSSQISGVSGLPNLDRLMQQVQATSIQRMFPRHAAPAKAGEVDLTKFYVLEYSSPMDAFTISKELSQLPEVQYAEPWFIYSVNEAAFTPSDTLLPQQWALAKVQADSAWNISQGDTSVVIGIIDTGVQWDHPDLNNNIWINPGESGLDTSNNDKQTNGIDDDTNGFVDDYHGWDFMGATFANPIEDNNPSPTTTVLTHGTHVAGIASASTDNVTGISGMGFRCRILPIKATADNDGTARPGPYIERGFEGIVYAADMGADIVNLSWGGYGASQAELEVINYATAKGTLVVAAAGNDNVTTPEYPASYPNVISVAATDVSDGKAPYSNYGNAIDVTAPGGNGSGSSTAILSTWYPNSYQSIYGTSMASPLVAGICALVKSYFPSYTNLQVGEQVRATCTGNFPAEFLFGKGRVNALKALTVSTSAIRVSSIIVKDSIGGNNNGNLEPNETFTIGADFTNYLQPTSSGTMVTLTSSDPYVQILSGTFAIGAVGTLGSANNYSSPFQVKVKVNAPAARVAQFILRITDGSYSDFHVFDLILNETYATINVNNVSTTLTNNGRIGFNDPFNNTQGVGFVYGGGNQLFEAGLIIGYSPTKLVDVVRNETGVDADFVSSQNFGLQIPGLISAVDGSTIFTDNAAPAANKIGLQVSEYSYAFTTTPDSDYIIVRYDVKNTTGATLSDVYVGLFFDWDMLPHYDTNKTALDSARNLGYAWNTSVSASNQVYCGVRALNGVASYRGLLLSATLPLDRAAKWSWLSGGNVPMSSTGDIHFAISSGPYTIASNEKQMVAFAVLGGRSLLHLQANADAAESKWIYILNLLDVKDGSGEIPLSYALQQNYPNPFNPVTSIRYEIPRTSFVQLQIFDVLGREVASLVNSEQSIGAYTVPFDGARLSSGVYFYKLTVRDPSVLSAVRFVDVKKLMLIK